MTENISYSTRTINTTLGDGVRVFFI